MKTVMKVTGNVLTAIGALRVIEIIYNSYDRKKKKWYLKGKLDAAIEMLDMAKNLFNDSESNESESDAEPEENNEEKES